MNGDLPPEVWDEREVAATLSPHDLGSDTRSVELVIAATLTLGGAPNSNPPGRRQEDDINLVAFDPNAGGDHTSSGAFETGTGITPTLGGARPHAVGTETTVRRLTPVECERLQGFPDNHTLTSNGKPQADSARYRQMGNAVAVPCVEWIVNRIVKADQ